MQTAFTPDRLRALAAKLRLWAVLFAAWLAEAFDHGPWKAAIDDDLRRAERGVKAIVALLALHRAAWAPACIRTHRPVSAPPGFAWRRARGNDLRRLTRRLLPRMRGLAARSRALLDALDRLDELIARLGRRLERCTPEARLAPVAPPATLLPGLAVCAARPDDSS